MYISHNICFFYSNVEPKKRHPIEEQENEETPQEKKLRLAKLYIDQLKEEGEFLLYIEIFVSLLNIHITIDSVKLHFAEEQKADDEAFESDLIAGRLQEEVVRGFHSMPRM